MDQGLTDQNNVDDACKCFQDIFLNSYNSCIPEKQCSKMQYKTNMKPWITKGFIKSSHVKNKLCKKILSSGTEESKIKYKTYQNRLTKIKNILKKNYYEQKFELLKGNTKQIWELINDISKRKKKEAVNITEFKLNNEPITDSKQIVNSFNDYFPNVGLDLAKKINVDTNLTFKHYLKGDFMDSMLLLPVCEAEDKKELENIDASKSCGHDNIMPRVAKYLAAELTVPLTYIRNLTFITGKIPVDLKTSIIVPVYKAGNKQQFNNYRPILLPPCISKVLEKVMDKKCINYVNKIGILSEHQFVFCKRHSTNFALIDLVNTITTVLDHKEFAIGVFLDLSKAFDTVNHSLLLQKIEYYGIRGIVLDWFKNYITKRYQCVRYNNKVSDKTEISCGVPQGSVLGPLLFLIYINDICNSSEQISFILFADDTNLLMSHKDPDTLMIQINRELELISTWLALNKLSLNLTKTTLYFLSRRKESKQINLLLRLKTKLFHKLSKLNSLA